MLHRRYVQACVCAAVVAASGSSAAAATSVPTPPTPPAPYMGEAPLPAPPTETVTGPTPSSGVQAAGESDGVVACTVTPKFLWNPKPDIAAYGVSQCINVNTLAFAAEDMEVEACLQLDYNGSTSNVACDKKGPTVTAYLPTPDIYGTCVKGYEYRTWAWNWISGGTPSSAVSTTSWQGCA